MHDKINKITSGAAQAGQSLQMPKLTRVFGGRKGHFVGFVVLQLKLHVNFIISEPIWVIVTVAEGGLLGVTQQLSKFGNDFIHNSVQQDTSISNPFASPTKSPREAQNYGVSPNSSIVAHPGIPYLTQLSPSPIQNPHHTDINGTTARSLFPVSYAL